MSTNTNTKTRQSREAFPFLRGVNFGYLAPQGYYGSSEARQEVDRMADQGVQWVSLMVMLVQENFASTRIFRDFRWTPSDQDLQGIIDHMHKKGIRVLLKPVIDCLDSCARRFIQFPDIDEQIAGVKTDYWSPWFQSNREAMTYYARLSREWGVEAFTIGQELEGADLQTEHWLEMISAVRAIYPGWLCVNAMTAHRNAPAFQEWVRQLDAVGFSNYWSVPFDQPTAEQVRATYANSLDEWRSFHQQVGLPVYWAEFGCRSVAAGARRPGEYRNVGAYDGQLQANYIDGFLQAYDGEPWWAGFQYWKWDEQQLRPHYPQAGGDTGFTVRGKPGAEVLARWCRGERQAVDA